VRFIVYLSHFDRMLDRVHGEKQDHRQGRAGPRPDFPQRQARPTGPGLGFVPSKARKPGTGLGFVSSKARKPGTGLGFGKNSHKALYFRASPENPGPVFPSGKFILCTAVSW